MSILHYGVETGVPTDVNLRFYIISGLNTDSSTYKMAENSANVAYVKDLTNIPSSLVIDQLTLTT